MTEPSGYQAPSYQPPTYGPPTYQPGQYQHPFGPPAGSAMIVSDRPVGRRRVWPPLLGLLALAAGAFVLVHLQRDSGGNDYPKHWDARVQAAVSFVEQDRGLSFKHPVKVEFLSPATFTARVTGGGESGDGQGSAGVMDDTAAELAAAGLVPSGLDLSKALKQLRGSSVLGYYDFASQHIVVRGSSLSPAATVTVVHELTHALQDQYYDIGHKGPQIARAATSRQHDGPTDGFQAVVEGDARRVEDDYVRSLSASDRAAVTSEEDAQRNAARTAIKNVPQVLLALEEVPYDLGRALVEYQRQAGGGESESALFQRWPSTDMEILQPWRYVDGDKAALTPTPGAPVGAKVFDHGTMGSIGWYFVLAERLGPARALAAIDGWAGDAFVAYRDHGRPCLAATVRPSSPSALSALKAAFSAWARTVRALDPKVWTNLVGLQVHSCAPAAGAHLAVPDKTGAALAYATNRTDLATALLRSGVAPGSAACIATRLLQRIPARVLASGKSTPRTQRIARQARAACG